MAYHKLYETKPGRHMIDHEHNQIVVFYQIKILLQLADFLSSQKKFPTNWSLFMLEYQEWTYPELMLWHEHDQIIAICVTTETWYAWGM